MDAMVTGNQFEWSTLSRGLGWYRTAVTIVAGIMIVFLCTFAVFLGGATPATVGWILTGYAIATASAFGTSTYALSLCRKAPDATGARPFARFGFFSALVATTLSIAGALFLAVLSTDYLTHEAFSSLRSGIGMVSNFAILASMIAFFVVLRRIARRFAEHRAIRLATIGLVGAVVTGVLSILEHASPELHAAIPFAVFISLGGWVAAAIAVGRAVPVLRRSIAAAAR